MESLIHEVFTLTRILVNYKRRQRSSGPLYVVAVIKVTPACSPVSTETVEHVFNATYEHTVAKIHLKSS